MTTVVSASSPAAHDWRAEFAETAPFHHVAHFAGQLAAPDWPSLARLNALAESQGLRNSAGLPLRFAVQHARCGQWDYEAGILASGQVPSRERNWHDLLNALTWLTFPRAKAVLNAVQCAELGTRRGTTRGARSDAATLFDESGVLLVAADAELPDLLAARRWEEAFVQRRRLWERARVYVFGHAVLEKLLAPWPGITAKCLFLRSDTLPAPGAPADGLDVDLAEAWRAGRVGRPADLFPLPVLGVPGWWPANGDPDFYRDAGVFRPLRDA